MFLTPELSFCTSLSISYFNKLGASKIGIDQDLSCIHSGCPYHPGFLLHGRGGTSLPADICHLWSVQAPRKIHSLTRLASVLTAPQSSQMRHSTQQCSGIVHFHCPFGLWQRYLSQRAAVKIQAPNRVCLAHSLVVGCLQPHLLHFQYPWDRRVEGTIPKNTWKQQLPLVVKRKTSLMKLRRINCQTVLRNPLIQSDITDGATKMQRTEGTRPMPRS